MGNKKVSKDEVIQRKKQGIRSLNDLLESFINSNNEDMYKKGFNIASWIHSYVNYLHFEKKFIPTKNIAYKRGDVIKVNLGYNVGNELGGIHYAVVIDKDNKHRSGMITIIPLSSKKDKVYERDIDLGNDLYKQLNNKLRTLKMSAYKEKEKAETLIDLVVNILSPYEPDEELSEDEARNVEKILDQMQAQGNDLDYKIALLKNMHEEIKRMKTGSIAKIEQITSISKMRIIDPKNTGGVLHNISLSADSMKLINSKLRELYFFDNEK